MINDQPLCGECDKPTDIIDTVAGQRMCRDCLADWCEETGQDYYYTEIVPTGRHRMDNFSRADYSVYYISQRVLYENAIAHANEKIRQIKGEV